MVTLQSADNALKSFYLEAITDSLDMKANPFLAKIAKTSADVVGKDVRKTVRVGVNGGIGAGTETGALPSASSGEYKQFVATLKNLYGTIEISDKAIRASANNEGAFVNLLNEEMQSLVKSASFNFGRMLFGDGSSFLAAHLNITDEGEIVVNSTAALAEGMVVDFAQIPTMPLDGFVGVKITSVDRVNKTIRISEPVETGDLPVGCGIYLHTSQMNELTGLGALFSDNDIYGVDRTAAFMKPYIVDEVGDISESVIQKAMDTVEESSGGKVNFILCSWGVRRALVEYYKKYNTVLPTMEVEGGFTALNFNGVPIVVDRFCPEGTMYLLNTDDFKLHQLCDWQWLEAEDGKILKQIAGKPVYTATLVKYAELMCERPNGQAMLGGITEA